MLFRFLCGLFQLTPTLMVLFFGSHLHALERDLTNIPSDNSEAAKVKRALDREIDFPSFINFPKEQLKMAAGERISVGNIALMLTKDGDVQVVKNNNTVVWHSGTHANCGACTLVMQSDGNVVLYVDGIGIWSTGTYSNRGEFLTLSAVPPYLSIRDGKFDVTWRTSDELGPTALLAASRVGPQAVAAKSFLESLAVNSHVAQNGIPATDMMKMLNYLGVKNVRDSWALTSQTTYKTMAQKGIRFDFLIGDPFAPQAIRELETMAAMAPGALLAVEGPNEINNWSFVTDGVSSPIGWPNQAGPLAQKFMSRLYANVHEKAVLPQTAVYNLTWGGTIDAKKYGMLDLAGQADFGNVHVYPPGQPYLVLQSAIAGAYHHVLPNQSVITEIGYSTNHISQEAQAILILNVYLSAFQQGFNKVFVYELYDEWEKSGLFQDANRPKRAATAIHNLTTLLADPVFPAELGKLDYVIPGLPATAHTLLLQKSNGAFYLAVWNEVPVYQDRADVVAANVPLTVSFGMKIRKINVFDPIDGLKPVQKSLNASTIDINLGSHALIVELLP